MSLKSKKRVQDFILEMLKEKNEQQKASIQLNNIFSELLIKDRRPPAGFKDSSFLFARSYISDMGLRPFSGILFWDSPDLEVSPINNEFALTTDLIAGQTYKLRCTVRNRGDLNVPSAKVEFWLVTPSLGFSTRYAKKIGVVDTWVKPYSLSEVTISYTVPASEVGHKCLFARIFAFSPIDLPIDDYGLNPTIDRHIAQKNLNIISQKSTYTFNLVHFPNAKVVLKVSAIKPSELLKIGINKSSDLKPISLNDTLNSLAVKPLNRKLESFKRGNSITLLFSGHCEFSTQKQKDIFDRLREFLSIRQKESVNEQQFKETLHQFRQLSKVKEMTSFQIDTSNLNIPSNSFGGFNITATDQNTKEEIGGITIIVTPKTDHGKA